MSGFFVFDRPDEDGNHYAVDLDNGEVWTDAQPDVDDRQEYAQRRREMHARLEQRLEAERDSSRDGCFLQFLFLVLVAAAAVAVAPIVG